MSRLDSKTEMLLRETRLEDYETKKYTPLYFRGVTRVGYK